MIKSPQFPGQIPCWADTCHPPMQTPPDADTPIQIHHPGQTDPVQIPSKQTPPDRHPSTPQTPPAPIPQINTPSLEGHPWLDTLPTGRHPPGQTPPPKTVTAMDGVHPTGMHSCLGQNSVRL